MKQYCIFAILAGSLCSMTAKSQVTIGSGISPNKAALLDLKTQETDESNVTSTLGGLLLSRVALSDLSTLEPFINPTELDYDQQKRAHTGLFVYNIATSENFIPGLYIWDGEHWNTVNTSYSSVPPVEVYIPAVKDGLPSPNSYIMSPGSSINIPIVKAYSIWKEYLDIDVDIEKQNVTVDLLWQDEKNMVSSVTLKQGATNAKSLINVTTRQGIEGNAVVVVRMDNIIRWSWHLWITDYDPKKIENQNITSQAVFMNRYLGATTSMPAQTGAIGLLYQWGRKDPFSGSASTTGVKEKVHYTLDNRTIDKPISKEAVNTSVNIANSITNPITYYTNTETTNGDWYSNSSLQNNEMWRGANQPKGIFDPCPEGWRVSTSADDGNSLWNELKGKRYDKGTGIEWQTHGYYQASGYRALDGSLIAVGEDIDVWSAVVPSHEYHAFNLKVSGWSVETSNRAQKARAHSVRCIKE